MKIDRVVFSLDTNKTYTGFWNVVSEVWNKCFDVIPTLGFLGTNEQVKQLGLSEEFGEIIVIKKPPVNSIDSTSWCTPCLLTYLPSQFPNDVCMTSGIDQLPLGSNLFIDSVKEISENRFYVGFGNAYGHNKWYPSSHLVAKGELYKSIFNINGDFESYIKEIEKWGVNNRSLAWGLDEWYLGDFLKNNPNVILGNIFDEWKSRRLCRAGTLEYRYERLQNNEYSELHAPRPYEQHKEYIDMLVKHILETR